MSITSAMPVVGGDGAGVADLAAALGVERGAIEEDLDGALARRPGSTASTVASVVSSAVADELGDAELLDDLAVALEPVVVDRGALAGRLGPLALGWPSRRRSPSTSTVDPALAGDLLGELEREAVGVVEGERRACPAARWRRSASSSSRMPRPVFSVWRKRSSSRVSTPTTKSRLLDHVGVGRRPSRRSRSRRATA